MIEKRIHIHLEWDGREWKESIAEEECDTDLPYGHVEFSAKHFSEGPPWYREQLVIDVWTFPDEYDEEEVRETVEEFKEWVEEGGHDAVEVFTKTIELLTALVPPYSTCGVKVYELYDSGGDYPIIEIKYDYLA